MVTNFTCNLLYIGRYFLLPFKRCYTITCILILLDVLKLLLLSKIIQCIYHIVVFFQNIQTYWENVILAWWNQYENIMQRVYMFIWNIMYFFIVEIQIQSIYELTAKWKSNMHVLSKIIKELFQVREKMLQIFHHVLFSIKSQRCWW